MPIPGLYQCGAGKCHGPHFMHQKGHIRRFMPEGFITYKCVKQEIREQLSVQITNAIFDSKIG